MGVQRLDELQSDLGLLSIEGKSVTQLKSKAPQKVAFGSKIPKDDPKAKTVPKVNSREANVRVSKQKENESELVVESAKPKIEGIFKKREKQAEPEARPRQVQFDITET